MILLDYREENETKKRARLDLKRHLQSLRVPVEQVTLEYGDAAFEMKGPEGPMMVGIERKGIHDMLNCIEDARLGGHQLVGMRENYDLSVLMVEGHWKPHDPSGVLMEGFNNGMSWGFCKPRGAATLYSKLYRYLISVSLSGVIVTQTRDPWHTAFCIAEWWHYGQKEWDSHISLKQLHKVALPTLNGKPSLTRKWANAIESIGVKKSELAERRFRSPLALANADETEWLKIPGIGVKTAQAIVAEIWGKR